MTPSKQRSVKERIIHATLFEVLAIVLTTPTLAWVMGVDMYATGALTIAVAITAFLCNIAYNALFDALQRRWGFRRTVPVRVLHACGFEGGLMLLILPMTAWWLSISLWHALVMDIGLLLFYLPFTFFFNLAYDNWRIPVQTAWARYVDRAANRYT